MKWRPGSLLNNNRSMFNTRNQRMETNILICIGDYTILTDWSCLHRHPYLLPFSSGWQCRLPQYSSCSAPLFLFNKRSSSEDGGAPLFLNGLAGWVLASWSFATARTGCSCLNEFPKYVEAPVPVSLLSCFPVSAFVAVRPIVSVLLEPPGLPAIVLKFRGL